MAFHGLKKELRAPILNEQWKTRARYLPLNEMFELAAQAEVTTVATISFPRFTEKLKSWNKNNYNNSNPKNYKQQQGSPNWPPQFRPPVYHQQQYNQEKNKQNDSTSYNNTKTDKKTESQLAWMRKRPCWICDKTRHLIKECTKKKPIGCQRCGKDHFLKDCLSRLKPTTTISCVTTESYDTNNPEVFSDFNSYTQAITTDLLRYRVEVNGIETMVIVDTGAQLSLIAQGEAERLGIHWDTDMIKQKIMGASDEQLKILGRVTLAFKYKNIKQKEEMFVVHLLRHPIILGLPWIRKHAPIVDWNDLSLTFNTGEV